MIEKPRAHSAFFHCRQSMRFLRDFEGSFFTRILKNFKSQSQWPYAPPYYDLSWSAYSFVYGVVPSFNKFSVSHLKACLNDQILLHCARLAPKVKCCRARVGMVRRNGGAHLHFPIQITFSLYNQFELTRHSFCSQSRTAHRIRLLTSFLFYFTLFWSVLIEHRACFIPNG